MKVISFSRDRLVLYRRNWGSFLFLGFWTLGALSVASYITWQEYPNLSGPVIGSFGMPLVGFICTWFSWWDITVTFERGSNEIRSVKRRLHGSSQKTYKLSNLSSVSFDFPIERNDLDLILDFNPPSEPLILPTTAERLFRTRNSAVEKLMADIRDWAGLPA